MPNNPPFPPGDEEDERFVEPLKSQPQTPLKGLSPTERIILRQHLEETRVQSPTTPKNPRRF